MYKAIELYTRGHGQVREQIVFTRFALQNLEKYYMYCETSGKTRGELAEEVGINITTLKKYLLGYTQPSLTSYLKIMDFKGFDHARLCRRDVNYAYANVSYSPEEIKRRLHRLNISPNGTGYGMRALARALSVRQHHVFDTIHYREQRSIHLYASIMFFIEREERARKLPHALKFFH